MDARGDRHDAAARSNYTNGDNLRKRQALSNFIVDFTGTPPDTFFTVLPEAGLIADVGCGNGIWAERIATPNRSVIGFDSSAGPTANGAAILGAHFATIETHRWETTYELAEPDPLVDFMDSLRDPVEAEIGEPLPWDEILERLDRATRNEIESAGPIRFARGGSVFIAHSKQRSQSTVGAPS